MERLYEMAKGINKRFPGGNEPFQIMTRLLEECGEVAAQVNHFENTGIKRQKHGEPDKEKIAGEIPQVLQAVMQIILYYELENEVDAAIAASIGRMKEVGLLPDTYVP